MSPRPHADFELTIGSPPGTPQEAGRYPIQATSPAGPVDGELELNLADETLKNLLSAGTAEGPALEQRKRVGQELFTRLFAGKVGELWVGSKNRIAAGEFPRLCLRLCFQAPELAVLPWELLCDGYDNFLATNSSLSVSRYLRVPGPPRHDPVSTLHVLLVISRPTSLQGQRATRITDTTVEKLKNAIQGPNDQRVNVDPVEVKSLLEIQTALMKKEYHMLHYLGHGEANLLLLTRADGSGNAGGVSEENLRQVVHGRRSLRAVVLNACWSSGTSATDVFAGVGPAFIQAGVPAVVAMQYERVNLDEAMLFNGTFYDCLRDGFAIDAAVTQGRVTLAANNVAGRGWSTPVLYVGTVRELVIVSASTNITRHLDKIVVGLLAVLPPTSWFALRKIFGALNALLWVEICCGVSFVALCIVWHFLNRKRARPAIANLVWFAGAVLTVIATAGYAEFKLWTPGV